ERRRRQRRSLLHQVSQRMVLARLAASRIASNSAITRLHELARTAAPWSTWCGCLASQLVVYDGGRAFGRVRPSKNPLPSNTPTGPQPWMQPPQPFRLCYPFLGATRALRQSTPLPTPNVINGVGSGGLAATPQNGVRR